MTTHPTTSSAAQAPRGVAAPNGPITMAICATAFWKPRAPSWKNRILGALTLRAVARRAGVSHAAPYRHFPNHEALLVELGLEGFAELRQFIVEAGQGRRAGIRPHRQYRRRLYALCRQAPGGGAADVRPPASQPRQVSRRWARRPTPSAPKSARRCHDPHSGPGGVGGGAWPGHAGAGECDRSGPAPLGPACAASRARKFCCAACFRPRGIKKFVMARECGPPS